MSHLCPSPKKKIVIVLPAYNAERTLLRTLAEIPSGYDNVLLVDDASSDRTVEIARSAGLEVGSPGSIAGEADCTVAVHG